MRKIRSFKKIYYLGRSKKFIRLFSSILNERKNEIIPWRDCENILDKKIKYKADLLVVCGYDYKSYLYPLDEYIKKNVCNPLNAIKKISNKSTTIFYINTEENLTKTTFSRYRYAKFLLGEKLSKEYKNFKQISPAVLLTEKGNIDIFGSFSLKIILKWCTFLGIIKTTTYRKLKLIVINKLQNSNQIKIHPIEPKFIALKRCQFLDRLLRLIYG